MVSPAERRCPDWLPEQNKPRGTIVISVWDHNQLMCLTSTVRGPVAMTKKISSFQGREVGLVCHSVYRKEGRLAGLAVYFWPHSVK